MIFLFPVYYIDTPREEDEAVSVIAERYVLNVTCSRRLTTSQNEKCSMCSKLIPI